MITYRGKYPSRVHSSWSMKGLPGIRHYLTNDGRIYHVPPFNGRGPRLGDDLEIWPNKIFITQSEQRTG